MAVQSPLQPQPTLAPQSAPLSTSPSVEGIIAQQPKRLEELNKDVEDTDKQIKDISAKESAMKMPELKTVPPPVAQSTNPAEIWGSSAMLFAALGGLMTRRPLVTALNAAGKVFQAYQQGDQAAAKQAFDSWKIANDNAMKVADFQQKQYKEALDGYEKDKTGALAALRAKMVAFQDETGVQQLDIHGIQGAQQHVIELKRLNDQMRKTDAELDQKNSQWQAYIGITNARKNLQAAQQSGDQSKITEAKAGLDAAVQNAKDLSEAYGKGGTASNFRSLPAAIANKYLQEHPDATADDLANFSADYTARNAAVKAFDSGTQGNSVRSFNTAIAHLSTLDSLVDALHNGNVEQVNKFAQEIAKQTGNPAPTNFDAAKAIVGDEIVKAIVGGGGALADRENAQNQINKAESPEQLRGVINTYKDLMGGQLRGLRKQYESSTGRDDFDKKLFPETLKQLKDAGGGKDGKSGDRGPALAHLKGKPIWPSTDGTHWVFEDGSEAK